MKLVKSILLGSAAGLIGAASAQAADLPTRKSAPVEYVRICDAYGAGFFYIPGTDTCLKVGGLVLADLRMSNPSYSVTPGYANGAARAAPTSAAYGGRSRDTYGYSALGRVELDTRTQTAWGTVRSFIRVDSYYGSSQIASTGSGAQGVSGAAIGNFTQNTSEARYTTILNKAFIQFAGLTAGYAQSMFDFYADAYNFEGLKGSNATTAMLAYTATFGGGFSASLSVEDQASRRTNVGSTIVGMMATPAGARIPDIVANIRVDQPWGAVQLSGAAHRVDTTLYYSAATAPQIPGTFTAPPTYFPTGSQNQYGFAAQLGVQYNMDMVSPGDKLWLQAAYEKGALSYVDGSNLAFTNGAPNFDRAPGDVTPSYGVGWNHGADYDCVWTGASCERQQGFAVVAAFKHYWMPTLASAVYGSFLRLNYSTNSINGANFITAGQGAGMLSYQEIRVGGNLVWTPIKGFDIGGEVMYIRNTQLTGTNPFPVLPAGIPQFTGTDNIVEGRLRVQRAF